MTTPSPPSIALPVHLDKSGGNAYPDIMDAKGRIVAKDVYYTDADSIVSALNAQQPVSSPAGDAPCAAMVAIEEIAANEFLAPSVYRSALIKLLAMRTGRNISPAAPVSAEAGRPVAWIKGHTVHTDCGIEYDEEVVAGRDPPTGDGWVPLYVQPTPSLTIEEREALEAGAESLLGKLNGDGASDWCAAQAAILRRLSTAAKGAE